MNALGLSALGRSAGFAPLVLRLILGFLIAAHGWQKLQAGPAMFGQNLEKLGVPLPELMAWVVVAVELGGGILLIVGFLTRLFALLLTINLVVAILLVKIKVGLIGEMGAGMELDLAYIAGFVALLLMGPGSASLDRQMGIDVGTTAEAGPRPGAAPV